MSFGEWISVAPLPGSAHLQESSVCDIECNEKIMALRRPTENHQHCVASLWAVLFERSNAEKSRLIPVSKIRFCTALIDSFLRKALTVDWFQV
jgi:hypothetical protein